MTGELFHVGFIYVLTISRSVETNGKQIKSIYQSINGNLNAYRLPTK